MNLTTIYWRDIPAQVTGQDGKNRHRIELPQRFQVAIDRAAMAAGMIGTDDYLANWRKETEAIETDNLERAVAHRADVLDQDWTSDVLNACVADFGYLNANPEPTNEEEA